MYPGVPQMARAGIGDFFHDLVVSNQSTFNIMYRDNSGYFSRHLIEPASEIGVQLIRDFHMMPRSDAGDAELVVSNTMLADLMKMRAFKHLLLKSGAFPIWTVNSVKEDSYKEFLEKKPQKLTAPIAKTLKEIIL